MSKLIDGNQVVNQIRKKKLLESEISKVLEDDIWLAYNPSAPMNRMLVADNDFFKIVHSIVGKKSFSFIPFLLTNSVFHANDKGMKDISKNVIKLAPYNLLEGAAQAGKLIYTRSGVPNVGRVDYRFLSQAYYLYSSLCVGVNSSGQASLITASQAVLFNSKCN